MPDVQNLKNSINSLNFNQNFECFVCGDRNGLRVFNSCPLKEIRREQFPNGVAFADLLYRCNYVALVDSQRSKVFVWDCGIGKAVIELEMGEPVLAIRLRRDVIVVVVEQAVAIFSFSDIPIQLMRTRTARNSDGICVLSSSDSHPYVAFPSAVSVGVIEIVHLPSKDRRRIYAHNHVIQALAFNSNGSLLGSASSNGTIIRIFETVKGHLLHELRRGANTARISCINFSFDSKLLCVSSNRSTIHVFELANGNGAIPKSSRTFAIFKGSPSVWKIPIKNKHDICQCAFESNTNSVIAIGMDGSYYSFYMNKKLGQYCQQSYCLFTELNSSHNYH